MTPTDTGDFEPSVAAAAQAFEKASGWDWRSSHDYYQRWRSECASPQTLARLAKQRVTITTVGIATHGVAEDKHIQRLATYAPGLKGKYHKVTNAKAASRRSINRKFVQISRPLIHENPNGFTPLRKPIDHEILKGIGKSVPPITGYVRSTVKNNPLVEVSLVAPEPGGDGGAKYNTVLASWTYGLGKVVALTTDTGGQWANAWSQSADYDRFMSQLIRWSMRPAGDTGKFAISSEVKDGTGRIIITAFDKDDEFTEFSHDERHSG